ncbi:MAG: hypothetical protein U0798_05830 [Gemmataceae bacterium]
MKTMKLNALNLVPLMRLPTSFSRPGRCVLCCCHRDCWCGFLPIDVEGKIRQPTNVARARRLRWKPQIEALGQQTNIYEAFNYPNPPIMALILRPIVALPPSSPPRRAGFLKVAMAAIMVFWSIRPVRGAGSTVAGNRYRHRPILALRRFWATVMAASTCSWPRSCSRRWNCSAAGGDFRAASCWLWRLPAKSPGPVPPYFIWKRAWMTNH